MRPTWLGFGVMLAASGGYWFSVSVPMTTFFSAVLSGIAFAVGIGVIIKEALHDPEFENQINDGIQEARMKELITTVNEKIQKTLDSRLDGLEPILVKFDKNINILQANQMTMDNKIHALHQGHVTIVKTVDDKPKIESPEITKIVDDIPAPPAPPQVRTDLEPMKPKVEKKDEPDEKKGGFAPIPDVGVIDNKAKLDKVKESFIKTVIPPMPPTPEMNPEFSLMDASLQQLEEGMSDIDWSKVKEHGKIGNERRRI